MATDNAEGKEKQREHIIQKANILSLQAPTPYASLAIRQGETSKQFKIVEPNNLLSLIKIGRLLSHIGLWIGEDDYDTTKVCGKVHAQQKSLRPVTGQKLTVFRRTTADDKAMRNSNGSFTTCSAY
ncbi:unnamed protein product, partial [Porites lobata]